MKLRKVAFGAELNPHYPKVALIDGEFVLVVSSLSLPETCLYMMEPHTAVDADKLLFAYTIYGTVIVKVIEAALGNFLEVSSTQPALGAPILVDAFGGATVSSIYVNFSEPIQDIDFSLITLSGSVSGPVAINPEIDETEENRLIILPGFSPGLTEGETATLTIPVGAVAGEDVGTVLGEEFVISWEVQSGGIG